MREPKIGERIAAHRRAAGHTQTSLAKELGWSPSTVNRIELGKQIPDADQLEAIASALGMSMQEFYAPAAQPGQAAGGEG